MNKHSWMRRLSNQLSRSKCIIFSVLLCGSLSIGARADIFGSPLVERGAGTDYCTGCLFAYLPVPVADVGDTLTSFAFYADQSPSFDTGSNLITPILYLKTGDSFTVEAIGTTRASTGPGIQSYAFDAVQGSPVLTANEWFGYRDGGQTAGSGNNGTISLGFSGGPGIYYYNGPLGAVNTTDTFTFTNASTESRIYSLNATATPEPSFYVLVFVSLCILAFVRFCKKAARNT